MKNNRPEIVKMTVKELQPAPYNPRKISDKALDGLTSSIDRFGLVQPIIWNRRTNRVVGGHQRLKVIQAKKETETDVVVVDLDESEEKALNIALNNHHICGEWTEDVEKLLAEIRETSPDVYDDLLLDALLHDIPKTIIEPSDEDDYFDENDESTCEETITQPGDLWILGKHRLFCGDSTRGEDFGLLMDDAKADMIFTDPPYGVSYCGTNNPNGREWDIIAGDELRGDDLYKLLKDSFSIMAKFAQPAAAFYIFHAALNQKIFEQALHDAGIRVKQQIIWVKHHVLGHSDYHWKHEPCFYGCFADRSCRFYGDRTNTTVWEIKKDASQEYQHPTQKPVALAMKAIENSSRYGDIILDMFSGSGSTLIACEQTGRKSYGMEIDPKYCDVIVNRWEKYTGSKAEKRSLKEACK